MNKQARVYRQFDLSRVMDTRLLNASLMFVLTVLHD